MNDISIYFQPLQGIVQTNEDALGNHIQYYTENAFPELKKGSIALIYCPEFRNGAPEFHQQSDDSFRTAFANLYPTANWNFEIADLGNLLPGERIEDTYFAIKQVVAELVRKSILPIIIGGTQDLTFPLYQGYQKLEQTINMAAIDYRFDLGSPDEVVSKDGYLSQILMHRPCYLFNHSTIGIQAPYVKQEEFDLFEKLYFDTCRLGEFNADFKIAEPYLRNADLLSIDLQAIRKSDISGPNYQQPNGFYADQVCQIAKYAGISDKLTSLGIFNFFPTHLGQDTHELVAQLIWYFLDGVSQRKGDFPIGTKKEYLKFMVYLEGTEKELVFYKSNKSERWWMEVPYPPKQGVKFERHHMVPCNYEDYELAMKNEMPDLWWKTYQKLS